MTFWSKFSVARRERRAEFLKRNLARGRDRIQQLTLPLPISAGVVAELGDKIVRLNENYASREIVEMLAKAGVGGDFILLTVANVLGIDEVASSEPLPEIATTDVRQYACIVATLQRNGGNRSQGRWRSATVATAPSFATKVF